MSTATQPDATQMQVRAAWQARLSDLFDELEGWAREADWPTRRVTKPMADPEAGEYTAPALVVQCDTARVMIEPVARSAVGADGVVDLYLMPAYDDIATLYHYKGAWHLHSALRHPAARATVNGGAATPLSADAFRQVIWSLATHVW